jgi:hypothetical protein
VPAKPSFESPRKVRPRKCLAARVSPSIEVANSKLNLRERREESRGASLPVTHGCRGTGHLPYRWHFWLEEPFASGLPAKIGTDALLSFERTNSR